VIDHAGLNDAPRCGVNKSTRVNSLTPPDAVHLALTVTFVVAQGLIWNFGTQCRPSRFIFTSCAPAGRPKEPFFDAASLEPEVSTMLGVLCCGRKARYLNRLNAEYG
jgi:hypothetical protein